MKRSWKIEANWELLDEGSPEERACFASIGIEACGRWLTEGRDLLANRLRSAPLLSGYHLAEWFAWNWWRLRWEPRATNRDWGFTHRMSNIGQGYIWPNIAIFSDGERTALVGKATVDSPANPFRYINNHSAVIPSGEFESEVDEFLDQILERLESQDLRKSKLAGIWNEVCEERRDPAIGQIRKFEALLGADADESNSSDVQKLIENSATLGNAAAEEIAADAGSSESTNVPTLTDLSQIAQRHGFSASHKDMVALEMAHHYTAQRDHIPAWKVGSEAAQLLRSKEYLGDGPLTDKRLAELVGTEKKVIDPGGPSDARFSFVLQKKSGAASVVLRSRWRTGRRFELARLLGDRLMSGTQMLYPSTRSLTYRQKLQRSFAAEFLCPFNAVLHHLQGDFSTEKQLDAAEYFEVSELTIRTLLVNHGILEREDLDADLATGQGKVSAANS